MDVSILLAHPNKQSFNHAIAEAACIMLQKNGHRVLMHDLYAERFDPLLYDEEFPEDAALPPQIAAHCQEIVSVDGIIIVHPNWWGQPPAILKGWVDRVMRPGLAYRFLDGDKGEGVPVGLLKAHVALVFNTSNTFPEREARVFGDPLETLWKNCILNFCGVQTCYRETFSPIVTSTEAERRAWLDQVRQVVAQYFPKNAR